MHSTERKAYPFLKASKPKANALKQYYSELTDLREAGLHRILDQGHQWAKEIAQNLDSGGGVLFPHTYVSKCGYQIAAVIHGILDSGNELKELAKNSVLVGTDDYCHHGIAYGVVKEAALPTDEQGLIFARKQIELGFSHLRNNNYRGYFDHWMNPEAIGDPCDVTMVMHYLIGQKASPKILDLKLVDVAPLFEEDPTPSWVAATLAIM